MKSEENLILACQREIRKIVDSGKVDLHYSPVYNPKKNKYVGYISYPAFTNLFLDIDKIKQVATQMDKINEFMCSIYKKQLVSFIKRRPNKQAKLFVVAKLEDLASFMEVYFSDLSFQDCKIILCLNVKKGYEMINKFSNITNNLHRLLSEGIELAVMINQSNMYDYDYILKMSHYLVLDKSVISISKNNLVENKLLNMLELSKTYNLGLFATDVDEYLEFECLLKYKVDAAFAIGNIGNDTISISARSKEKVDVGAVMQELAGGGNQFSGATKLKDITSEEAGKKLIEKRVNVIAVVCKFDEPPEDNYKEVKVYLRKLKRKQEKIPIYI